MWVHTGEFHAIGPFVIRLIFGRIDTRRGGDGIYSSIAVADLDRALVPL
jgi:hypothetical protein